MPAETAYEAETAAREALDVETLVSQAALEADSREEAEDLASEKVESAIDEEVDAPDHLKEFAAEEIGWEAGKAAKTEYARNRLENSSRFAEWAGEEGH